MPDIHESRALRVRIEADNQLRVICDSHTPTPFTEEITTRVDPAQSCFQMDVQEGSDLIPELVRHLANITIYGIPPSQDCKEIHVKFDVEFDTLMSKTRIRLSADYNSFRLPILIEGNRQLRLSIKNPLSKEEMQRLEDTKHKLFGSMKTKKGTDNQPILVGARNKPEPPPKPMRLEVSMINISYSILIQRLEDTKHKLFGSMKTKKGTDNQPILVGARNKPEPPPKPMRLEVSMINISYSILIQRLEDTKHKLFGSMKTKKGTDNQPILVGARNKPEPPPKPTRLESLSSKHKQTIEDLSVQLAQQKASRDREQELGRRVKTEFDQAQELLTVAQKREAEACQKKMELEAALERAEHEHQATLADLKLAMCRVDHLQAALHDDLDLDSESEHEEVNAREQSWTGVMDTRVNSNLTSPMPNSTSSGGAARTGFGGKMKIYFCGSIRAGRQDADLYRTIIGMLQKYGTVLTEHIGSEEPVNAPHLQGISPENKDKVVFKTDTDWLHSADVVVAEVTQLGVGFELGVAWKLEKPTLCLFRPSTGWGLSAMITGAENDKLKVVNYEKVEQLTDTLEAFFSSKR